MIERIPKPELLDIKPSPVKPHNSLSYRAKVTDTVNIEMINNIFYNKVTAGQSILIQGGC